MNRQTIAPHDLSLRLFELWDRKWFLLACGDFAGRRFNSMTVSWGAMGIMWNRPFAMIVVRPQRYTRGFLEQFDNFTLSAFPEQYKKQLDVLGTQSGREMDKINFAGLTAIASAQVSSPSFDEAELIVECRKMYFDDYEPRNFLAPGIARMYDGDYHRMYFGEIVAAHGIADYRAAGR